MKTMKCVDCGTEVSDKFYQSLDYTNCRCFLCINHLLQIYSNHYVSEIIRNDIHKVKGDENI